MHTRNLVTRSYFCHKVNKRVTLLEYSKYNSECEGACGILSCSHQDQCGEPAVPGGKSVFAWAHCPACLERSIHLK